MPVNIRSTLAPYYRKDRRQWYPRGTYPVKAEDGSIERRRGYAGAGSDTRAACQADCDRLNAALEREATTALEPTFEEAAEVYLSTGGDGRFLHDKLLDAIGHYRVNEIDDAVMLRVKSKVYPTATPATVNRQLFTPVISVLRLASKNKQWKPDLTRPKGALKLKPAKAPSDEWFTAMRSAAEATLTGKRIWALLLFLTLHGRRPSDGFRNVPADFDPKRGTIAIEKDKAGNARTVQLAPIVVEAIEATPWRDGPGLFGNYTWANRRNAYRRLKQLCEATGQPYFTFHKAGRHKFAKRLLGLGYSTTFVAQSGGWANGRMVDALYGRDAQSEVDTATRDAAQGWADGLAKGATVTVLPKRASGSPRTR